MRASGVRGECVSSSVVTSGSRRSAAAAPRVPAADMNTQRPSALVETPWMVAGTQSRSSQQWRWGVREGRATRIGRPTLYSSLGAAASKTAKRGHRRNMSMARFLVFSVTWFLKDLGYETVQRRWTSRGRQ